MMERKVSVYMPVEWLLILAVHGNMGDGEIPDLMKRWAIEKLRESGFHGRYKKMQEERLIELKKRIANVIGQDKVDQIEGECKMAAEYLKKNREDTVN